MTHPFYVNFPRTVLIIFIILVSIDFLNNPEKYGDIMKRFDEARFGEMITE